ncbi:GTP cyclohydrolase I FolE [Modestobacter sp. VKM Ac-2985]|uniref:GTP cyclohydrolase I FolE n=1 Tax=Modestobacter sp. VKM Ac-2985 TaxID=3004139 RepID=UPI0022AB844E|nr:GTP cyclohydrolase I FolE [Modestobacter sp. VKM Ac-2985]MCZ2836255.1 GTP cyclohydrolase I FolE [Modestobacter sp. VKM Ac-2985]
MSDAVGGVALGGVAPDGTAAGRAVPAGDDGHGTAERAPVDGVGLDPRTGDPVADLPDGQVDTARIEAAVREILIAIGEDPDRSGLVDTPARVARAYGETFAGLAQDPYDVLATTFDEEHDELVLVKDIPMYSTCEHHLVPFHGRAHVGYIPGTDGRVTGLSKLARLVEVYARRPQVQERMTRQIADSLFEVLKPQGVIVVVEAEHLCMAMRGIRKPGSSTITSAVRGIFRENPATRSEAMSLILQR